MGHKPFQGTNQYHEPIVTSHEEFMELARDPEWAEKFVAGTAGKRGKYRRKMLGYTMEDWDAEAGRFMGEERNLKYGSRGMRGARAFNPYSGSPKRDTEGWDAMSEEQRGEFADVLEETMSNYLKSQEAEAKGASLLDNIAAKSDTMEQLIANRRALREEELKQTRGLY